MPKFRKKAIVIEAVQWDYDEFENTFNDIKALGDKKTPLYLKRPGELYIQTLEGTMFVEKGAMVIKGVEGELYACDLNIFLKLYDQV